MNRNHWKWWMSCAAGFYQSQRDCNPKSKGCEERATLGQVFHDFATPTGLRPLEEGVLISDDATYDSSPLGMEIIQKPIPRVVATLQPLGFGIKPRWVFYG